MMSVLRNAWSERTSRERRLLGVMIVLLAACSLWFGAIVPLREAQARAQLRLAVATADAAIIDNDLLRLAAARRAPRRTLSGSVIEQVEESAERSGLILLRHDAAGSDGAMVSVASAKAPVVFAWLVALEAEGLVVDAIKLHPAPDAGIAADVTLRARRR